MKEAKMNVKVLGMTENAEDIIYAAFRQCYTKGFIGDKWEDILNNRIPKEEKDNLIFNILYSGHESPIEHVSFTFAIDGVSRDLTHQLVRHRIASYSQQSQRYTGKGDFQYVTPNSFKKVNGAEELYIEYLEYMNKVYDELSNKLKEAGYEKASKEDARIVLPSGTATRIVMTMNCRSLHNFFEMRCCNRAQWQIRNLANMILKVCKEKLPIIFSNSGPKCERIGFCFENEKFSCGEKPNINRLKENDND